MASKKPVTADDVAAWMASEFAQAGVLYQARTAAEIETRFGPSFVYRNSDGGKAIDKAVLKAFRGLTPEAIWNRWALSWRTRRPGDPPGRMTP